VTFEEDPDFTEKALHMIGDDGIFAIQMFLMVQPDAGDIIPGSGGCRKLRWAAKSSAGPPRVMGNEAVHG